MREWATEVRVRVRVEIKERPSQSISQSCQSVMQIGKSRYRCKWFLVDVPRLGE